MRNGACVIASVIAVSVSHSCIKAHRSAFFKFITSRDKASLALELIPPEDTHEQQ